MKAGKTLDRHLIRKSLIRIAFLLIVSLVIALIHNAHNENGLVLDLTNEQAYDDYLDLP